MSAFAKRLIELWDEDFELAIGVPYRRMASEANEIHESELASLRAENERLTAQNEGLREALEVERMLTYVNLLKEMDESVYPEAYGFIAGWLEYALKEHRKRDMIACPETCFCWEAESFLTGREATKEL